MFSTLDLFIGLGGLLVAAVLCAPFLLWRRRATSAARRPAPVAAAELHKTTS